MKCHTYESHAKYYFSKHTGQSINLKMRFENT